LKHHLSIIRESIHLYKLTIFDRNAAIKELERDEATIKAAKLQNETGEKVDSDEFMKSLQELAPKMFEDAKKITGINDVITMVGDNKDELKNVAKNRLEIMGEAIQQFMEGYREGRDTGFKDATEDDKYLRSLMDPLKDEMEGSGKIPTAAAKSGTDPSSTGTHLAADTANPNIEKSNQNGTTSNIVKGNENRSYTDDSKKSAS
jgi:hypothetical protein